MPKIVKPLTDKEISRAKPKKDMYLLADGNHLFLRVKSNGSKIWLFNYTYSLDKKRTNLSLGNYPTVTLAQARAKRDEYLVLLDQGIDPKKEIERLQEESKSHDKNTFLAVAENFFNGIYKERAKDPETRSKNWARLEKYVFPYIGKKPVSEITLKEIVRIYELANNTSSTLKKLHQLTTNIMDHAITQGIIESHNINLAIKNFHIKAPEHYPTIELNQLEKLFADLAVSGMWVQTYLLICWSFLTALRPSEAVNAEWKEIDFDNCLLHIPKEKMKGGLRPHVVPLSRQALAILDFMRPLSGHSDFVFLGRGKHFKPMSSQTANGALKRNGYKGLLVAHGIRSFVKTFLASENTPRHVSEKVLSHLLEDGDTLENTYNRYEYIEERRPIMQFIADHCEQSGMNLTAEFLHKKSELYRHRPKKKSV